VDDPDMLSAEEENTEIDNRGKIQVTIQRGKYKARRKTRREMAETPSQTEKLLAGEASTKKVARDNGKSHFTKYDACCAAIILLRLTDLRQVPLNPVPIEDVLPETTGKWVEAEGEDGKEIEFTFYYTNRSA
jgi:hypothetical protein